MTRIVSTSPEQTVDIGRRLGERLEPGSVVSLEGPLGCGKTTLAKGVAAALGVGDEVTSPSFTLVSSYSGRLVLHHVDLYRLDSQAEIQDLGLEELMGGDGVTLIEWGEKAVSLLPADTIRVRFSLAEDGHILTLEGVEL